MEVDFRIRNEPATGFDRIPRRQTLFTNSRFRFVHNSSANLFRYGPFSLGTRSGLGKTLARLNSGFLRRTKGALLIRNIEMD